MRVPVLVLFVACLFQFSISFAQTAEKVELSFDSYAFAMGVNKQEQVIVGTGMGEVALTDSINGLWRKCRVKPGAGFLLNTAIINNICYFNADTAFVAGLITGKDQHQIIYHTVDGGKNWKPIDIGSGAHVNDASFLDNGEAWLSMEGGIPARLFRFLY